MDVRLQYLIIYHALEANFIFGDIQDKKSIQKVIQNEKFDAIFHLAVQVAMTSSIENPYKDFEINALGTINVLEAVRKFSPKTAVFFSSTNKVYGDLEQYEYIENESRYICSQFPNGFDETIPLDFCSPYGCSKGTADQYMIDFHRIYGLKTVVFRHSSMYGFMQQSLSLLELFSLLEKNIKYKNEIRKTPIKS